MGWYGLDSFGPGQGPEADSCEHGNKSSSFIKRWEILQQLSACWLLTKDSMELVNNVW
jgi:hypothetical protein